MTPPSAALANIVPKLSLTDTSSISTNITGPNDVVWRDSQKKYDAKYSPCEPDHNVVRHYEHANEYTARDSPYIALETSNGDLWRIDLSGLPPYGGHFEVVVAD